MTTLPSRFPLSVPHAPERASGIPSGPSAPPMNPGTSRNEPRSVPERSVAAEHPPEEAETPANLTRSRSFYYDRVRGGYPMEWSGPAEFEAWRQEEELAYSIELIASSTVHSGGRALWTLKRVYVCSHQLSRGRSKYQKKHPDQHRKIESKKTGCRCRIVIKFYPHTTAILGRYKSEHDHEVGLANIAYTRMLQVAREKIRYKLSLKIDPREIVCMRTLFLAVDLIQSQVRDIRDSAHDGSRDRFISLHDVCRMARAVKEENIRLHKEDGISTKLWLD